MPISLAVRNTLRAISPLLATRSRLIVIEFYLHSEDAEAFSALDFVVTTGGQG